MSQIFRKVILHCVKANQRAIGHRSVTQYAGTRIAQSSSQCIAIKSHFSTLPGETSASPEAESSTSEDGKASRYANSPRYETEMPIEQNKAGLLIGQSGAQIRQLMQMTGCGIHVRQDEDESRVVIISSEVESRLAYAKEVIHEIVNNQSNSMAASQGFDVGKEYNLVCEIPQSKLGILVGKGGNNINRLRGLNNCNITTEAAQEGSSKVKVTFSSGNVLNCFRARDSALAHLNLTRDSLQCDEHVMNMPVPTRFAGELVGRAGATIRLLQQLAKCEIRMAPGGRDKVESEVVISGVERDCEDARDIVTALASIHKRHNPNPNTGT